MGVVGCIGAIRCGDDHCVAPIATRRQQECSDERYGLACGDAPPLLEVEHGPPNPPYDLDLTVGVYGLVVAVGTEWNEPIWPRLVSFVCGLMGLKISKNIKLIWYKAGFFPVDYNKRPWRRYSVHAVALHLQGYPVAVWQIRKP